jgi:hypothetical protein
MVPPEFVWVRALLESAARAGHAEPRAWKLSVSDMTFLIPVAYSSRTLPPALDSSCKVYQAVCHHAWVVEPELRHLGGTATLACGTQVVVIVGSWANMGEVRVQYRSENPPGLFWSEFTFPSLTLWTMHASTVPLEVAPSVFETYRVLHSDRMPPGSALKASVRLVDA